RLPRSADAVLKERATEAGTEGAHTGPLVVTSNIPSNSLLLGVFGALSALDDAEGGQLCDPSREARPRDDVDDPVDVLVGERRFLGEPLVGGRADDDSARLELAAEVGALDLLAGARARERPAGTVTGRAEGELQGAGL